jgi:hypothetical protein
VILLNSITIRGFAETQTQMQTQTQQKASAAVTTNNQPRISDTKKG